MDPTIVVQTGQIRRVVAVPAIAALAIMSMTAVAVLVRNHWTQREREIAAAGFAFLDDVSQAQTAYRLANGRFAWQIDKLDLRMPAPAHYSVLPSVVGDRHAKQTAWSVTLRRPRSLFGYGGYTITYSEKGYEPALSTVAESLAPRANLSRLTASLSR